MTIQPAEPDYILEDIDLENVPPPLSEEKTIRVLLIEDCISDVYLVESMLYEATPGLVFDIISVPRLGEALDALDEKTFDVVLLDLNLMDIDGVASVAALNAESPNLPIIVYSGSDDPRLREEAFLCGARHFLKKGKESAATLRFIIHQVISHRSI